MSEPPPAPLAAIVAHLEQPGAAALSRLAAVAVGLAGTLRRIVLVGEGVGSPERLAPGLLAVHVPPEAGADAAIVAGVAAALERDPVDGFVVLDDRVVEWPLEDLALLRASSLAMVAGTAGFAGWLAVDDGRALRPGLALCSRAAWTALGGRAPAALRGEAAARRGEPPRLDLRALARLAELEVPVSAVTPELARGLSLRRWLSGRGREDGRLQVDEATFPASVAAGEVPIVVTGWVARLPQPERLELRVGPRRLEVPVATPRPDVLARHPFLPDDRCGFRFAAAVGGLPPGRHTVAIGLPGRPAARRLGTITVQGMPRERPALPARAAWPEAAAAPLAVDRCVATAEGDGELRLELEGSLTLEVPADVLSILVDGATLADLDPRSFSAQTGPRGATVHGFRASEPLAAAAGTREVRLVARRRGSALAEWRGEIVVPELGRRVRLESATVERLRREAPGVAWGALVVEGGVAGAPAGARVALEGPGGELASAPVDAEGRFRVVRRLGDGERLEAACVVRAGEAELARSGSFEVLARPLALAPRAVDALADVLDALAPAAAPLREAGAEPLLRCALELRPSLRGELEAALATLSRRLREARERPARRGEPAAAPARPRRVLFVAWEIPWSGHGGGVCMVNLLRHLGARGAGHEITLIHPTHPGAEGLSDEVREDVREILTVPRGWRSPAEPAPFGVPAGHLRTWSPELRAAVAAELGTGRHELANFEYFGGWLHAPPLATVPDLLAFYESTAFALASTGPDRFATEHDAADRLLGLLGALHFETVLVPARFPRLVALTAPEADLLAPFLPGASLTVNPIPIDVARLAAGAAAAAPPDRPTFVYLGSYRHPPNLEAARALVDEVAPLLRAGLPGCRVVLAGDRAPVELVEAARRAGVEHLGWVDDPPRLLGGATAFVAPIATGAGMRVKHLEAMACGCPVATTALGMSGIAAEPGRDYLRGESAAELAEAAMRLARDPELRSRIAASARARVARDHAPAVQGERRARIWEAAVEEGRGDG